MNIKVNLQDGTPAQFKTEVIDGNLVVTVVEEKKQEENLFPKWEELEIKDAGYEITEPHFCIFTTYDLAKAVLATARVSQTYRRYRELVGEVGSYVVVFGILKLVFRNEDDFRAFCRANREDLDLISIVEDTVQL